jgi:hypothetical protein
MLDLLTLLRGDFDVEVVRSDDDGWLALIDTDEHQVSIDLYLDERGFEVALLLSHYPPGWLRVERPRELSTPLRSMLEVRCGC